MNKAICPYTDGCEYHRIDTDTGQCDGTKYEQCNHYKAYAKVAGGENNGTIINCAS